MVCGLQLAQHGVRLGQQGVAHQVRNGICQFSSEAAQVVLERGNLAIERLALLFHRLKELASLAGRIAHGLGDLVHTHGALGYAVVETRHALARALGNLLQGVEPAIYHLLDVLQVNLSCAAHLRIAHRDAVHRLAVALRDVAQHGHFFNCIVSSKAVLHQHLRDLREVCHLKRRFCAHRAQALHNLVCLFRASGHGGKAGRQLFDVRVVFDTRHARHAHCRADRAVNHRRALGHALGNRADA